MTKQNISEFEGLGLNPTALDAIRHVGYETPSAIQSETIPVLLRGVDVIGQAQTGTGKTAAFALPILNEIDIAKAAPQALVLAPTRELAIQVAEAFRTYSFGLNGFRVLPVYGGQDYRTQLRSLDRGVHVVVGTPGRIMDHMRRGTLKLDNIKTLVLDEADEMLRMGFIDDVEWILEKLPEKRQIALFSATMPARIRKIAATYLNSPSEIIIKVKTTTAATIDQRFCIVNGGSKLDALTRILEAEPFDAVLVFVRTRISTEDLCGKLEARGYACAPINGDIVQHQREKTIQQLRAGKLDILVATDVAARGLDVSRISHVINYDIPYDVEAYVHRIGRTGRAGKKGQAILFVTPREKRMLHAIEKSTGKQISPLQLPTPDMVNQRRKERFYQQISDTIAGGNLETFHELVNSFCERESEDPVRVAAALALMAQGDSPFLLPDQPVREFSTSRSEKPHKDRKHPRNKERKSQVESRKGRAKAGDQSTSRKPVSRKPAPFQQGMERFRVEVGSSHGAEAGNIVGAIANEAGLDSQFIGKVQIFEEHSLVDLPEDMPKRIFRDLKKVWVAGQRLAITQYQTGTGGQDPARKPGKKKFAKPAAKSAKRPADSHPKTRDKGKPKDKSAKKKNGKSEVKRDRK